MELRTFMKLQKHDVVSITGAGGKTTLMFTLAEELRATNRVLVTTSAKIFVPEKGTYDYLFIGGQPVKAEQPGLYVIGTEVTPERKLICGVLPDFRSFDYSLIEADGARRKALKGWNETEPAVSPFTTVTVGVLAINAVGTRICEENVHRLPEFLKLTGKREGETVDEEALIRIILEENGLFKNASGRKILFINKAEGAEFLRHARSLSKRIGKENRVDQIIVASLKNQVWEAGCEC